MGVKQVIVVRTDLSMRKGKLAAQVAHASLKVFLEHMDTIVCGKGRREGLIDRTLTYAESSPMDIWLRDSFTKIVVGCDNEEELFDIYHRAKQQYLPCVIIKDAGRTEFDGVPTNTCVAIGPSASLYIDKITGGLKLL